MSRSTDERKTIPKRSRSSCVRCAGVPVISVWTKRLWELVVVIWSSSIWDIKWLMYQQHYVDVNCNIVGWHDGAAGSLTSSQLQVTGSILSSSYCLCGVSRVLRVSAWFPLGYLVSSEIHAIRQKHRILRCCSIPNIQDSFNSNW